MNSLVIFDCFETLIFKKDLAQTVRKFISDELKVAVPIKSVQAAYGIIYERHKFLHPRFNSSQERLNYYISYNKELLAIMGLQVSNGFAGALNKALAKTHWESFPDTVPALRKLSFQKQPMGLIANWTNSLENVLEKLDLKRYFNFIFSSHALKIQKPDPRIFSQALKKIPGKYKKIYYVGDDYDLDIVSSRQAGLTPILIDRTGKYPSGTDCLKISRLTQLLKVLK